ncbi:MAG TPA: alpha/beta hydrolase [Streptosporangiaceae bacterium]|nr:alpha/beta hydrolase [Streptosporangiaceae bacterium]
MSETNDLSETESQSTTQQLGRRRIATAFGDIAYAETGSGSVALFVHGVFLNANLWRHQLAALGDIRRCVAVDLLAHGASPCPPPGPFTLQTQADMVLALLDALGADSADLVGNDTGGAITQLVAAKAPHRVRSLTLTNCDAHDNWPPPAFDPIREMATTGTLAAALPALATDPALARSSLAMGFEHPDDLPDEYLTGMFAPFTDPAKASALQDYIAAMDSSVTVAIRDDLARLQAPTLVVWGTADEFFDKSWARWLEELIPGTVRRTELDGAKLFFPAERWQEFNLELRWLWSGRFAR